MIELLLFTFVTYGMTTILVYGSIFNGVRDFIHQQAQDENGFILTRPIFKFLSGLIVCPLCTSTWVGFFLSLTLFSPIKHFIELNNFYYVFFDGMFAAGIVWALNAIIEWFEENRLNNQKQTVEYILPDEDEPQQQKEILND
jgi:hypothetical protein